MLGLFNNDCLTEMAAVSFLLIVFSISCSQELRLILLPASRFGFRQLNLMPAKTCDIGSHNRKSKELKAEDFDRFIKELTFGKRAGEKEMFYETLMLTYFLFFRNAGKTPRIEV